MGIKIRKKDREMTSYEITCTKAVASACPNNIQRYIPAVEITIFSQKISGIVLLLGHIAK